MAYFSTRGVDIGWLPFLEEEGVIYRDFNGKPVEMFSYLKTLGIDAVRQRVWVNPKADEWFSGSCDIKQCVEVGRRTIGAGMDYMVDFHYSNSWADPGKQFTPKEWENDTLEEMAQHVYEHTKECMEALRDAGVQPRWVQTGNEIDNGMMLPTGDPKKSPEKLAKLIRAGYDAVHEVFPTGTSCILHLAIGWNREIALPYLANVVKFGGAFDIFGSSYYPYWVAREQDENDETLHIAMHDRMKEEARLCFAEIQRLYNVPSMIVEIGGHVDEPDESYRVVRDMVKYCDEETSPCTGVFFWEPEAFRSRCFYPLGAWNNDGTPSKAMLGFARD